MLKTHQEQRLWFPRPMSLNNIFRDAGYGNDSKRHGRIKTHEYAQWRKLAEQELMLQKCKQHEGKVTLAFYVGTVSVLADCSNYIKGMEDVLVGMGVIEADNQKCVQGVSVDWVPNYHGAVVHIRPYEESAPHWIGFDAGVLGQTEASPLSAFVKSPQTLGKARRAKTGEAWASPEGATGRKRADARKVSKATAKAIDEAAAKFSNALRRLADK